MNRFFRQIAGVVFVLVIAFSFIIITQNIGKSWKVDVTEKKLYTLCDGTMSIIGKLNQPLKMRLYYAKTAAMKAPDSIKYFNNYYEYVKSLLEEYVAVSNGMIELEVVDPRPYSDEELTATKYGIKRFPITEDENFFFGLVLQTQFGVEKNIPFFSPARQNFIEYDISYLIENAITRQKKRIGILSSLEVAGDDVTPYMAKMMQMQGQQPKQPWGFVEQLKEQYEVTKISPDTSKIEDIDLLMVIHPKNFEEKTLFAIDQFVLKGGRTIVCVDPYCIADLPSQTAMMQSRTPPNPASELNKLMVNWGLEMPKDTFAGDKTLAAKASLRQGQRPERILGYLEMNSANCNQDTVITSDLNELRFLYSGILKKLIVEEKELKERNIQRTPLIMTTARGNSWTVSNPYELMMPNPAEMMNRFVEGTEPVNMAYLVTGRFKSAFAEGIDIEVPLPENPDDPNAPKTKTEHLNALAEAQQDCAVIVFADVDFITDMLSYNRNTFFGTMVVGDNSALMMNAVDDLGGSSELISIRSRGSFKRPFEKVDLIEQKAEAETAEEENKINAQIKGFESELQSILANSGKGKDEIIGNSIIQKKKELELEILKARKQLRTVKMNRRKSIESLGNQLRSFNMLSAPAVILIIVIVLSVRASVKKRKYISHASDA